MTPVQPMVETFLGSSRQNFGENLSKDKSRKSSDKIPSNIQSRRNVSNIFGSFPPYPPHSDHSFNTNVSRFKRASNDDRYDNTQKEESPNTHSVEINDRQAKRKVLKVIKRKPKLLSRDIMIDPTTSTQEYLDQVKSTLVINPTRKRIAITRKKTKNGSDDISSSPLPEVTIAPTKRIKKILRSKKRLLSERPVQSELDYEEEIPISSYSPPTPIIYTTETLILDTITTTTTRQRTYTYVVTRVNDHQSVVMSSTSVKDHVGPATQTVTRTISLTITIPPIQQLQTRLPE